MGEKAFDPAAAVRKNLDGPDEDFDPAAAVRSTLSPPAASPDARGSISNPAIPGDPPDRAPTPRGPSVARRILGGRPGGGPGVLAGSMAGGLQAMRAAPPHPAAQAIAGVAGGILGSGAGYWLDEFAKDMVRRFDADSDLGKAPPTAVRMQQSGEVMLDDAMYGMGASSFGPLLRLGIRKLGGVTDTGLDIARRAQKVGINLSIADVTEGSVIPWVTTMFGKFPLVSVPIKKHAQNLAKEVQQSADRLFLHMAPLSAMGKMGRRIDRIADAHFRLFRQTINKEYQAVFDMARGTSSEVPAGPAVAAADAFLEILRRGRSEQSVQKHPFYSWYMSEIGNPAAKQTMLEGATTTGQGAVRFKEHMSVDRAVGLIQSLDEIITETKNSGINWKELLEPFHEAIQKSMADVTRMITDPKTGQQKRIVNKTVAEAWSRVDAKFSGLLKEIFETRVAKALNRVTGGRFRPTAITKENTRPPEYTINILSENNTKSNWESVAKLIPGRRTAWVAGHWLTDSFRKAMKFDATSPSGFELFSSEKGDFSLAEWFKRTGMDDPNSAAYEGTKTALEKSDMSWKAFKDFNDALVAAVRSNVPNVSSFIARKVNISGISAFRSILLPGAGAVGGSAFAQGELTTAAAILMMGNTFSQFVADPRLMRIATKALDTTEKVAVRKMAILALANAWNSGTDVDAELGTKLSEPLQFPVFSGAADLVEKGASWVDQFLQDRFKE